MKRPLRGPLWYHNQKFFISDLRVYFKFSNTFAILPGINNFSYSPYENIRNIIKETICCHHHHNNQQILTVEVLLVSHPIIHTFDSIYK